MTTVGDTVYLVGVSIAYEGICSGLHIYASKEAALKKAEELTVQNLQHFLPDGRYEMESTENSTNFVIYHCPAHESKDWDTIVFVDTMSIQ